MLEIRCLGTDRVKDGQIVVTAEVVGGYQGAHLGATKYVVDLLGPVEVDDRCDDRPEDRGPPERHRSLLPVGKLKCHDVPRADPSGPKCTGKVPGLIENLTEGPLPGADRRTDFHSLGGLLGDSSSDDKSE